jgi:formiminotetrahydrofolate cyclodeaminase
MPFSSLSVSAFLDALASAEPTPGGGTAAAMAGAMGVSLLTMVAGLSRTRGNTDEERAALADVRAQLTPLRAALEDCADRDTEAFNHVMAAYRLPKGTDEEKAARKAAVQAGLIIAADVPLEICRVAVEVCRLSKVAAEKGNPQAVTDAGIGAILGEAAVVGAALNVRINLGSIEDCDYTSAAAAEIDRIEAEAAALRAEVLAITLSKL